MGDRPALVEHAESVPHETLIALRLIGHARRLGCPLDCLLCHADANGLFYDRFNDQFKFRPSGPWAPRMPFALSDERRLELLVGGLDDMILSGCPPRVVDTIAAYYGLRYDLDLGGYDVACPSGRAARRLRTSRLSSKPDIVAKPRHMSPSAICDRAMASLSKRDP